MSKFVLAAIVAAFALPAVAAEDMVGSLTPDEVKKVAGFGRDVGHAYQCADEETRAEMKNDMRLVFDFIVQDMGSDTAFLYAVTVGYGGAETNEDVDCEALAAEWQRVLKEFDIVREEQ